MSSYAYSNQTRQSGQCTAQQQAYFPAQHQHQQRQHQPSPSSYTSSSTSSPYYSSASPGSSTSSSNGSSPPYSSYSHSPPQHHSQPTSPNRSSQPNKSAKEPGPYLCFYKEHSPPYSAPVSFKRKPDLNRHYDQVHNAPAVKVLVCPVPGCARGPGGGRAGFGRKDKLREHVREVHGVELG